MKIDMRPILREFVWEALDGLITQADGAQRFLERGDDAFAEAAMRRAADFFRQAAGTMNELLADNKRRASEREREVA
jgi:hypothetical protein